MTDPSYQRLKRGLSADDPDLCRAALREAHRRADLDTLERAASCLGFDETAIAALVGAIPREIASALLEEAHATLGDSLDVAARDGVEGVSESALAALGTHWLIETRRRLRADEQRLDRATRNRLRTAVMHWLGFIERLAAAPATPWLVVQLFAELEASERALARRVLRRSRRILGDRLVEPVITLLSRRAEECSHRRMLYEAFVEDAPEVSTMLLLDGLDDRSHSVRGSCVDALAERGQDVLEALHPRLVEGPKRRRRAAAEVAERIASPASAEVLEGALEDARDGKVRAALENALRACAAAGGQARETGASPSRDGDAARDTWLVSRSQESIPRWVDIDALPTLSWASGLEVSDDATRRLVGRLTLEAPRNHDPGLRELAQHLDAQTADRFLDALRRQWHAHETDVRRRCYGWPFYAIAVLASDEAVEALHDEIFEAQHVRATNKMRRAFVVLERHASDAALGVLRYWSQSARRRAIRGAADDAWRELLRGRGLEFEEAFWRSIRRHRLDERGRRTLDYLGTAVDLVLSPGGGVSWARAGEAPASRMPGPTRNVPASERRATKRHLDRVRNELEGTVAEVRRLAEDPEPTFERAVYASVIAAHPVISRVLHGRKVRVDGALETITVA